MKRRGFLTALAALVASPLARKGVNESEAKCVVPPKLQEKMKFTETGTITLGGDVASVHGYNVTWHQFNSEPRRP